MFGGPVEQFLGVYSGRITDQSDFGFVWKAEAVRDIIDQGVAGSVYEIVVPIDGLNGARAPVTTAWEVRGAAPPRLVTAYVDLP